MRAMVVAAAALCLCSGPAWADVSGAARALDGVTLEIDGKRIALYGVEGPPVEQSCNEWVQQGQRTFRCGALARAFLQSLVASNAVFCVDEGPPQDGRVPATCFADGRDLARSLVGAGWAVAAQGGSGRYVDAEQAARQARTGLWAGSSADPDLWRRARAGRR